MRLYLVRHGKAEKDSPTGRDEDRPLQPRGEQQARWLGETISFLPRPQQPTLILTSPAVRARETARLIQAPLKCPLHLTDALRIGEPIEDAVALVRSASAELAPDAALMLVGHNPMMEVLVEQLARDDSGSQSEVRTGEAVVIEFPSARLEAPGRLVGRMRSPE